MDIIRVPAPPKDAFHKLRPISNLIKAQVDHFKHLEEKLSAEQRKAIPNHRITSEQDAALYIAAMTRSLRSGVDTQPAKQKTITITNKRPADVRPGEGLAIAASAPRVSTPVPKQSKASSKKKK